MELLVGVTQGLALMMSIGFLTYVTVIVVPFLRRTPEPAGDPALFGWHLLIPCRDEEAVIGGTMEYVRREFPAAEVWIVDDASDDRTARIVEDRAGWDDAIHLVRRVRPDARVGKGEALNAGYRAIRAWAEENVPHWPLHRTVICVLDGDGRLSPHALHVAAGPKLFGDPAVSAVQVDVRMVNRDDEEVLPRRGRVGNFFGRTLVRMQDLEFRTAIAAIQLSRRTTGTVGMGGNGQLTRISALDDIDQGDGRPWRGSLLEDFELGVHLITAGHRTEFTPDAHVDQEGLPQLRRLLTQRTRWSQGTMQCIRYLPRVWQAPQVSTLGAAEVLYYLVQPWMQLIGSVVYPVPWILLIIRTARDPGEVGDWFLHGPGWLLFCVYGGFGLLPFIIWGPIYRRACEPTASLSRSLGWGVAYAAYIYTFYVTCWRAAFRLVRKRNGWSKTTRNREALRGAVITDA